MRKLLTSACAVGAVAAMAAPALAVGPGTGDERRAQHQPSGTPQYNGSDNPGAQHRHSTPSPRSKRALGVVCRSEGASRSNKDDPEPGTPFSRCVRSLARTLKTACADQPKQRQEGDTGRGTPFSRCVTELAKGLRASVRKTRNDRRQARIACRRPDFDSGREYRRCVRLTARTLRRA